MDKTVTAYVPEHVYEMIVKMAEQWKISVNEAVGIILLMWAGESERRDILMNEELKRR